MAGSPLMEQNFRRPQHRLDRKGTDLPGSGTLSVEVFGFGTRVTQFVRQSTMTRAGAFVGLPTY
ncbi:hypothetical protein RvY_11872 [Ramazzottius varieornatus]|uniref:Uncharacterized protein n=1 Tax=Ramazzottius varieornatus TaxID=947166 RepID=A0A1D1VHM0_RAMVA|nr:hypothetical protein RvY_11872 [Ramazzottius varieornatus]